jgi:hypothetical protein
MTKETTKYNSNILSSGFVEGCYTSENDYGNIEGSKMKDNNKLGENIEDMVKDTYNLLNNARGA